MILDNKEMNLNLLQEECAELIQAVSKIRRFGLRFQNPLTNETNRESLIQELEDVQIFMDAVKEDYEITTKESNDAYMRKMRKLRTWYNKKSS